ncbi:MAG: 2-amino-4-hydroxy-6-hydroxymethyldihydropteridine diphosphokinase [Pirellula sp.]
MPSSLISLGANLGNTLETMRAAARLLRDSFRDAEFQFSSIYRTPAVGGPTGQGDFLNAMVRVDHGGRVWEVWEKIKQIETELGRQRFRRWESRRIDIDLILHDRELIWTPHLKVPHPRMSMRTFVIHPACQVAHDLIDPVTGLAISELSRRLDSIHPPRISFGCSSAKLLSQIESRLKQVGEIDAQRIRLWFCNQPSAWPKGWPQADLHIACVDVPDPDNVQWEDYCLPWASAMGFTKPMAVGSDLCTSPNDSAIGARYLVPAMDIEWVCHEIQAATIAMRCPIQVTADSWIA